MSQVIGGLVGALGASFILRRIKEIKMYYAESGRHKVLIAVCTSSECVIDHVDVDGRTYSDVDLYSNDLILGGEVNIKSGKMFIMAVEAVGMV